MKIKDLIEQLQKLDGEKTIGLSGVIDDIDQVMLEETENIEIFEADSENLDYVLA